MASDDESVPEDKKSSQGARAGSKARASAPTKAERVRYFRDRMAAGTFVTGLTVREASEEWGLALQTCQLDSAEASRSFEPSEDERATAKARWLAQLQGATANARKLNRCEAEARFLELQAKAEGFLEPQKVELSGSLGDLLSLATGSGGEDPGEPLGE